MAKWDLNYMKSVLEDFYTLTNVRVGIIDENFNQLLAYPKERDRFCALIRKDPKINRTCVESDKKGCMLCSKTKELTRYICPSGLNETVIPILDNGSIVGYIMFGHILIDDRCPDIQEELKKRFPDSKYPGASDAIDSITIKTEKEMHAIATLLRALPAYVLSNKGIISNKHDFIIELNGYIQEHISEKITSMDLCDRFLISRTQLYKLCTSYLDCTLSDYILRARIKNAIDLLESTDIPVAEVAYQSGFSDYSNFSRFFKQKVGMSAREYRKSRQDQSL